MAELVIPPRGRHKALEREETAIAVMGPLVPRQRGPGGQLPNLAGGNQNHQNATRKSSTPTDQEVTDFLKSSGKVSVKELCSYITPDAINNQDQRIAPIINGINDIINNMAKTRRMLLYYKLTRKGNPAEINIMEKNLIRWPVQVQQMQGDIEALEGRCLRIPHDLVTDLVLLD